MSDKSSEEPGLANRPFDDSTSLVEAIFQASSDLLFYLEADGRIVDYVAGNSSALYTSPENFLGRRMVDVLPEEVAGLFAQALEETLKTEQVCSLEYELAVPAGRRSYEAKCILRSGGKIIIIVRDLTELKKAEAISRRRLEDMTVLYENAKGLSRELDSRMLGKYIVRSCVEQFGVELAWIGSVRPDRPLQTLARWPNETRPANSIAGLEPTPDELAMLLESKTWLIEPRTFATGVDGQRALFPLISHDRVVAVLALIALQEDFFTPERLSFFHGYSLLAASSVENAHLFEDSSHQLGQIQTLRFIDQAILSALDLSATANMIIEEAARRMHADALNLLLFDAKTGLLSSIHGYGFRFGAFQQALIQNGKICARELAFEEQVKYFRNLDELGSLPDFPMLQEEGFKSYLGVPLIVRNEVKGMLEIFQRNEFEPTQDWLRLLEAIANQIAIAMDNSLLLEGLRNSSVELGIAYEATIEGLSRALELRDRETEGHTRRVTEMTLQLARQMGVSENDLVHIRQGALLHDIGKMGIPDAILLKPGTLTPAEWEIMRQHPNYACEILSQIEYLKPALDIPLYHHEKWDGTGYPFGLQAEQIPLAARIFAIVDVYDALTSNRPYRAAWTLKQTLDHIRSQAGRYFDPGVVQAFLQLAEGNSLHHLAEHPLSLQRPNSLYLR